jgi:hypothetical protein
MIASNASWIERNAPSRESFCMLALLNMLIGAPRILDDPLAGARTVLPAFSILRFLDAAIAAMAAPRNSEGKLTGHRSQAREETYDEHAIGANFICR